LVEDNTEEKPKSTLTRIEDYIFKKLSASPIVNKITPEREEEISDNLAQLIAKYKLERPLGAIFEVLKPFSLIFSNVVVLPASPFLYLFGVDGFRYVDFFEKSSNIELLQEKLKKFAFK
jgi:hypothetical protein